MAGPGPDSIAAILGRCLARAPPEDESSWDDELFTMLAMCGYVRAYNVCGCYGRAPPSL